MLRVLYIVHAHDMPRQFTREDPPMQIALYEVTETTSTLVDANACVTDMFPIFGDEPTPEEVAEVADVTEQLERFGRVCVGGGAGPLFLLVAEGR
jgi:hypothetical protein